MSRSASEITAYFDLEERDLEKSDPQEDLGDLRPSELRESGRPRAAGSAVWLPRYNVAPGQDIAVVVGSAASEERRLEFRRWGLVPRYAPSADGGPRPINARLETAHDKKTFRDALRKRRCLVPADGFYEWKKEGGRKLPHHLALPGGSLFAMAALYEAWKGDKGEVVQTVALLTTEAVGPARVIHDRMPVILTPEQQVLWLDPGWDGQKAGARCPPRAALELVARPVGKRVNDVRHDDPTCLELEPLPLFGSS